MISVAILAPGRRRECHCVAAVAGPDQPGMQTDDYWKVAQAELLTNPKLVEMLSTFGKDNIPRDAIAKIGPYINREDFDTEIKKASEACYAMHVWVRAM